MEFEKYNHIQVDLIIESGLSPEEWIHDYSSKFREIISKGIIDINEIRHSLYD